MLGPFQQSLSSHGHKSAPYDRPKKDVSVEASTGDPPRRVITNLSFPENASVNDGIARNFFQGENTAYSLPTVIDLANDVAQRGKGCLMWKTDLQRAYASSASTHWIIPYSPFSIKEQHTWTYVLASVAVLLEPHSKGCRMQYAT